MFSSLSAFLPEFWHGNLSCGSFLSAPSGTSMRVCTAELQIACELHE